MGVDRVDYNVLPGKPIYRDDKPEKNIDIDGGIDKLPVKGNKNLTEDVKDTSGVLYGRDVIVKENWENVKNYNCKIVDIKDDSIDCEIVIDKDVGEIQRWELALNLFMNVNPRIGNLIILSVKQKAGSIRYDIYKGENLVDPKFFEFKGDMENLKGAGLEDKIEF
jgi:hypothetical protein